MSNTGTIPDATVLALADLITPTEHGIASRVLARSGGANVTLFAFDQGESLAEHTTPFDALALTLEGSLSLTIDGNRVETQRQPQRARLRLRRRRVCRCEQRGSDAERE